MPEQKNYYAIIPADVRYDKNLKDKAKLLYAEITSLCNEEGICLATNDYFANLYGVSKTTISLLIKELVEYGYINSQIIYKEGSKEILNRYLSIVKYPIKENLNTPIKEKLKVNNNIYNINNINNNIIDNKYDKYIISNEYIISKKKENKKDINIFLKERKIEYENEFIDVWKLYPKKVGMQKSKEYYVNARIDGVDKETIVNGINAYVDFIKKENKDRKYIKDGSTWFHQKCWNDEYEEEVSTPQNVDVPDGYVLKGGKLWQK